MPDLRRLNGTSGNGVFCADSPCLAAAILPLSTCCPFLSIAAWRGRRPPHMNRTGNCQGSRTGRESGIVGGQRRRKPETRNQKPCAMKSLEPVPQRLAADGVSRPTGIYRGRIYIAWRAGSSAIYGSGCSEPGLKVESCPSGVRMAFRKRATGAGILHGLTGEGDLP